jgi:hypothetical protein
VITQHSRRAKPRDVDQQASKWRHLIENFFQNISCLKRIALRGKKTGQSFVAMIDLPRCHPLADNLNRPSSNIRPDGSIRSGVLLEKT